MTRVPRISVVGGCGVGFIFRVARSPQPGESVLASGVTMVYGGKAANQAIGAAALGASVVLISAVGSDSMAATALRTLRDEGVDLSGVIEFRDSMTMLGSVEVDASGENRIVIAPGVLAHLKPEHIESQEAKIAESDLCLVSLEIPPAPARTALEIARSHGVISVLNPAPAPSPPQASALLAVADYLTPNLTEAIEILGASSAAEDMAESLRAAGAANVVITCGADGAVLATREVTHFIEAPAVSVVDTAGAGDGFNASFAVALASGSDPVTAVHAGCRGGAAIVQGPGFLGALNHLRLLKGIVRTES